MRAIIFLTLILLSGSLTGLAQNTLPYGLTWGMTHTEVRSHFERYGYTVQDVTLSNDQHTLRVGRSNMNLVRRSVDEIIVHFDEAQRIGSVCAYFPPVDSETQRDAVRAISRFVQREATGRVVRNQTSTIADEKDLDGTILLAITGGGKYVTVSSHSIAGDFRACVSFTDIEYLKSKAK